MSCFVFSLWLSDAITHVPAVFLLGMLVNVPLDTFVYLTTHEGNEMKYTVFGGTSEKLEGRSAMQQGLRKVEESRGKKLLKINPDKCEDSAEKQHCAAVLVDRDLCTW